MKKKLVLLFSVLALCLFTSLTVYATEESPIYVVDELDYLTEARIQEINQLGEQWADQLGIDILYVFTTDESLNHYVENNKLGKFEDQIIMLENTKNWNVYLRGRAQELITDDDITALREAYRVEEYYSTGVLAYFNAAGHLLIEKTGDSDGQVQIDSDVIMLYLRVEDGADLLSLEEEEELCTKLDEISEKHQMDVAVVTVDSLNGKTAMDYADDFYDNSGYEYADEGNGVLLLISMEERDWWISTCGYGITAFTDAGIQYIGDQMVDHLSWGEYKEAFDLYAELSDDFIEQAKGGSPYDTGNLPKKPFNKGFSFGIALIIGFVLSLIINMGMKSQLKTVAYQKSARFYEKKDSLQLIHSSEVLVDKKVFHERRSDDDSPSRSGGSSTHTSSSGRSHGGGGGKF